jgi:hypothetical protein
MISLAGLWQIEEYRLSDRDCHRNSVNPKQEMHLSELPCQAQMMSQPFAKDVNLHGFEIKPIRPFPSIRK